MFDTFDAQLVMDELPDALLLIADDGTIVAANRICEDLFGYAADELVGRPVEMLVPDPHRSTHPAHRDAFVAQGGRRPMGGAPFLAAQHRDGEWVDVQVQLATLPGTSTTMAVVRDVGADRARLGRLRGEVELVLAVARGAAVESAMQLAAGRMRDLVHADAAWVWLCDEASGELVMAGGSADGEDALSGVSAASLGDAVAGSGEATMIDAGDPSHPFNGYTQLGYGPLLAARIGRDATTGVLVAARVAHRRAFTDAEREIAEGFAAVVLMAVELDRSRDALDRIAISSERVRVARELHDTVVQRLYAIGLRLEATMERAEPALAREITTVLDQLSATSSEIRATIHELDDGDLGQPLVQMVTSIAAAFAEPAALATTIRVDDELDELLPTALRRHLLSVLRECLANVVRHAEATTLAVVVSRDGGRLTATVTDDGIGPPAPGTGRGHGLINMTTRAAQLGGEFRLEASAGGGTVATWSVPIGPSRPV